jgi:hypothetical protein
MASDAAVDPGGVAEDAERRAVEPELELTSTRCAPAPTRRATTGQDLTRGRNSAGPTRPTPSGRLSCRPRRVLFSIAKARTARPAADRCPSTTATG